MKFSKMIFIKFSITHSKEIHVVKLFAHERRKRILDILNHQKRITVKELSEYTNVSEATLRADLNAMEQEGLLIRTYGGAMVNEKTESGNSFSEREKKNREEKIRIGEKAASLVQPGQCILLDASTTALEMARSLKTRPIRLTVVTNGLMTAMELKENPSITVILIGGLLRIGSTSVEGTLGANILETINVDTMFTSASGFTMEAGLTDFNVYEVELKKVMANSADRLVALLDHTKIGASSIASFASAYQIDTLITDIEPAAELMDSLAEKNIELIVA